MPSLTPGYNYDIFISYRQKDNKYDGWVTEFVDNLKRELESMFKDEVSVYFDINPSDYLLETYDVDASLRDKLKCLVFIPIVSRTYCDPKAFAWNHEFKAFIDQASNDKFGLKVPLPNGNVASRVLPVRIHDLDISDLKLCESILGGVFRGVDFIYSEPGVNRPLRSNEDSPHSNLNHTIYRNQINKVALAVREIIESLKAPVSPDGAKPEDAQKKESKEKKDIKTEQAGRKETIEQEQEVKTEPIRPEKEKRSPSAGKSRILLPAIMAVFAVLIIATFLLYRHSRIKWAREEALPEIERLSNEMNFRDAFDLVQKSEKYISGDPKLVELELFVVRKITVLTDPPGADVYIREYSDPDGEWRNIGKTPIDTLEMPRHTFYRMRIEKPGYEKVMAVAYIGSDTLSRTLFREGSVPENMVHVEGYWDEVKDVFLTDGYGFYMDRYEVTNRQFKEFVDNGGYRKPEYWKNEFIKEGKRLKWDEAIALFTDKTGRPGPSTWEAGDYPDGQDDFPVCGVSWYEAAAYAGFAGKSLPTGDHWDSGAGFYDPHVYESFGSKLYPLSNFGGKGPEPVGKNRGINCFGAYDMAGNVREWCWNETGLGRLIAGGGWSDVTYTYTGWNQLSPFDRSPENGLRCVKYIEKDKIPETAYRLIDLGSGSRDYSKEVPVSDEVFLIYKNQFLYDKTALDATIDEKDISPEDWIVEKISFNAAYGNERMIAYLFLPKNASPPFQTLIFFPGSYAVTEKDLKNSGNSHYFIDFVLKSGRAVMYPVYFRTYERNDGETSHGARQTHQYTELLIKWVKDFSRSIDYLETRDDIDKEKLAFGGHSWGGIIGGVIPAVEDRLAINILIVGGFWGQAFPEADAINYVSRVKIPTLMLNGRYDYRFPLSTNLEPFFNLLGTPKKDKKICIYETDHYVAKSDMIREVLGWLDKYFGPPNYLGKQ
jgi:dienelactone hydrolase